MRPDTNFCKDIHAEEILSEASGTGHNTALPTFRIFTKMKYQNSPTFPGFPCPF